MSLPRHPAGISERICHTSNPSGGNTKDKPSLKKKIPCTVDGSTGDDWETRNLISLLLINETIRFHEHRLATGKH
jgi:hypothetical protein